MSKIVIKIRHANSDSMQAQFTKDEQRYNPFPNNRNTPDGFIIVHIEQLKKLYQTSIAAGDSVEIVAPGDGRIEWRIANEPMQEKAKKRGRPKKQPSIAESSQKKSKTSGQTEKTGPPTPEPEWVAIFRLYLRLRRPVIMIAGEPGIGKTTLALKVLKEEFKRDVTVIDGDSEILPSFFLGHWTIGNTDKGLQTVWHPGIIEQTVARGAVLLINEADALNPDTLLKVVQSLGGNPLVPSYFSLHDGRQLDVSHYDITPVVMTGNTFGEGGSIDYHRQQFDRAVHDRISIIKATSLPIEHLLSLVKWEGVGFSEEQIGILKGKLCQIAEALKRYEIALSNRSIMRIGQLTLALLGKSQSEKRLHECLAYALQCERQRFSDQIDPEVLEKLM